MACDFFPGTYEQIRWEKNPTMWINRMTNGCWMVTLGNEW